MKSKILGSILADVMKPKRMRFVGKTIPKWIGSISVAALLLPAPLASGGGEVSADLGVDKSSSPDPVGAGSNVTYTIVVTNAGPSSASVATLTDETPIHTTFQSIVEPSGWACSTPSVGASGTIMCSNLTFISGATSVFTIVVEVDAQTGEGTVITNVAEVFSTIIPDLIPSDNSATNLTTVSPGAATADLAISKVDSPDPVFVGSNLTYTITITNRGPESATLLSLVDTLPANVSFVSASSGCGNQLGIVTCDLGTLASGGSTNVTIVVTTLASGSITNTAEVSSEILDSVSTNNIATAVTTVNPEGPIADLAVSKTDSPDPLFVGSNLTYTVTITNRGPDAAISVVLEDALPDEVAFVSASSGCGELAGLVTCNLGTLASGATTNVTIVVTATDSGLITNAAEVSSAVADSVATNNAATAVTTVNPAGQNADLAVTKTDSPDPVGVGSNLTYTITITNSGPDTATVVVLEDALPDTVSFVSASSGCDEDAGLVTCNLGTLASGAHTNVSIVVTPNESGSITNIVDVDGNVNDPSLGNNTTQQVTTVLGDVISGIDLTGTWFDVVATCKNDNGKVKGKIIIENLGTEDAGTSFVDFYLSDDDEFDVNDAFLKQIATGKVKPDKAKRKNLSAPLHDECFTGKFLIAVIDADDTVAESDEDNNIIVFGPLP